VGGVEEWRIKPSQLSTKLKLKLKLKLSLAKKRKQAEAEVVPSSSLVKLS